MTVSTSAVSPGINKKLLVNGLVILAIVTVVSVLVWQAITSHGAPTVDDVNAEALKNGTMSPVAVIMNTGILVFREGLEAILVLAALTASLVKTRQGYWKPVTVGAGLSFVASVATWFIVVAIISSINASALHIQAATGLLAILVLLVIMNWFFHNIYWAGWIKHHNRRKKSLTESTDQTSSAVFRGLVLLGFTAVYREGFEIVLFLQPLRLRAGTGVVLEGFSIGLGLSLIVAFLTFVLHQRLPYKKMLVITGILLGGVLLVMVGEQIQEMQQAGWIRTSDLGVNIPDWMGTWFAIFPNWQGIAAQVLAGAFVIGSFFAARRICTKKITSATSAANPNSLNVVNTNCVVPDCDGCDAVPATGMND